MTINSTPKHLSAMALILLLAAAIFLAGGCSTKKPTPKSEAAAKTKVEIGLDNSGSSARQLPAAILNLSKVATLLPSDTWLNVRSVNKSVATLRSGPTPATADALTEELLSRLKAPKGSNDGTRLDLLLSKLTRSAKQSKGKVAIVIVSDMFPDKVGRRGLRSLRNSAATLAANPKVTSVILIGAAVDASDVVEDVFAPLIPSKLRRFNLRNFDASAVAEATGL